MKAANFFVCRVQLVLEESRPFIVQGLFCLIKIHRLKSVRTINAIYFHEPAFSIAKILPVGIKYSFRDSSFGECSLTFFKKTNLFNHLFKH